MSYDDGLFDLRQIDAITSDLRVLCQDLADRLQTSDPTAALEFAEDLKSRRIAAETFVEKFRDDIIQRLNPSAKTRSILIEALMRKTH